MSGLLSAELMSASSQILCFGLGCLTAVSGSVSPLESVNNILLFTAHVLLHVPDHSHVDICVCRESENRVLLPMVLGE